MNEEQRVKLFLDKSSSQQIHDFINALRKINDQELNELIPRLLLLV